MTDVLTPEEFEQEWQERQRLAPVPPQRLAVRVKVSQTEDDLTTIRAIARPLLSAFMEALLEFEPMPPPQRRPPRRIRRTINR